MPFLTGDDTSDTVDISFTLPDDELLIAAVLGQLSSLTYASEWEQHGTATPTERADQMRTALANLDHAPGGDMLVPIDRMPDYVFTEEYANPIDAGTFSSGAWRDRTLNTITINRDGGASLSGNEWLVPVGDYWLYAFGVGYRVKNHMLRVLRVADSFIRSPYSATAPYSRSDVLSTSNKAEIWINFTMFGSNPHLLQHRCITTKTVNGFGVKSTIEQWVASSVMLWRVD